MRRRLPVFIFVVLLLTLSLSACKDSEQETVIIYTSAEDYRIEYMQHRLTEMFPHYEIIIEYMSTGNHAARLFAEGKETSCDICYDLEYGYMEQLAREGLFADISSFYDLSVYAEDAIVSNYYIPEYRNGCAIIVNTDLISEHKLDIPRSYSDLLRPEYKGLISMPSPKASGTGYAFLLARVNELGVDAAFDYFDQLTENILQYTSSGSGPVNALIAGEAAIGLGITGQAVTQINEGAPLQIVFPPEGSPYAMYGQSIVSGHEEKDAVRKVFDFLINTYSDENCENFFPERIYRNKTFEIENYPSDIVYADMSNNTVETKTSLLEKWLY